MRDRADEIRERGAELVIIGNGAASFAEAFREDLGVDGPLLVDPGLRAYRAAGLRRGRVEALSPRLAANALRALRAGYRQQGVQGDPWQLGGVFVIRPDGELSFRHTSREAGDHPALDDVVAALSQSAPAIEEGQPVNPAARWIGRGLARVIDPAIPVSFARPGLLARSLAFDPSDLDVDLSDRRCVVTGANSGLGYEAALALADLGADVVLACRNRERGEEAAERIREQTGSTRVSVETIDLSDLASVHDAASRLGERPLDVLVHNAGLLPDERTETRDGLELTWATHVIGPHLLTRLLLPALEKAEEARVIWVSSGGMYTRRLNLDDPNWQERDYDGVLAYAETKRAQVVLSELWAEKLAGRGIRVNAMHPGWADTPGVRSSLPGFFRVTRAVLRSPAEGADTVVWLAASPRAADVSGGFFFDREPRATHYLPWTRESEEDRHRLWQLCEAAAGDAA